MIIILYGSRFSCVYRGHVCRRGAGIESDRRGIAGGKDRQAGRSGGAPVRRSDIKIPPASGRSRKISVLL